MKTLKFKRVLLEAPKKEECVYWGDVEDWENILCFIGRDQNMQLKKCSKLNPNPKTDKLNKYFTIRDFKLIPIKVYEKQEQELDEDYVLLDDLNIENRAAYGKYFFIGKEDGVIREAFFKTTIYDYLKDGGELYIQIFDK